MTDQTPVGPERCAFSIGATPRGTQPQTLRSVLFACTPSRNGPHMSHNTTPASPLTLSLAALGLALAFPASGCQHGQRVDQMTQAVESGERPVAMAGSEAFFAGKTTARVTVSRGIGHCFKRSNATFLHGPTGFVST